MRGISKKSGTPSHLGVSVFLLCTGLRDLQDVQDPCINDWSILCVQVHHTSGQIPSDLGPLFSCNEISSSVGHASIILILPSFNPSLFSISQLVDRFLVTERRVSSTNLDVAAPMFAEHLRIPAALPPDRIHDVLFPSTSLSDEDSDQPPRLSFIVTTHLTVSHRPPRTSQTNLCNFSTAHPTHHDLPTGHTRLDDRRRS